MTTTSEPLFRVQCLCRDCGQQLNITSELTERRIRDRWIEIVTAQPLVTRPCPKGCRSTASDCNANVTIHIIDAAGTVVENFWPERR